MTLLEAKSDEALRIVDIMAGRKLRLSLALLGIEIGSVIQVSRSAPFSGPFIIKYNESETAIGRGIASKIVVERIQ